MKYTLILLMFTLTMTVYAQDSDEEAASCSELMAQKKELREEYKSGKHAESRAFKEWDKYYKQLHSIEYGGTDRPLADTAKSCEAGEGPDELFCKEALKRYGELSGKEKQAKKELDAVKADAEQKGEQMRAVSVTIKQQDCSK